MQQRLLTSSRCLLKISGGVTHDIVRVERKIQRCRTQTVYYSTVPVKCSASNVPCAYSIIPKLACLLVCHSTIIDRLRSHHNATGGCVLQQVPPHRAMQITHCRHGMDDIAAYV